jgi:DNA polymerase-4
MGIATNKLVAQIASKLRKPRGFVTVPPGEEGAFLAPLGIGKLPGVGPKTEETLKSHGLLASATSSSYRSRVSP